MAPRARSGAGRQGEAPGPRGGYRRAAPARRWWGGGFRLEGGAPALGKRVVESRPRGVGSCLPGYGTTRDGLWDVNNNGGGAIARHPRCYPPARGLESASGVAARGAGGAGVHVVKLVLVDRVGDLARLDLARVGQGLQGAGDDRVGVGEEVRAHRVAGVVVPEPCRAAVV